MASTLETFTTTQVLLYLDRIHFDAPNGSATLPTPTLETLRRLIACHLQAIPFENLSLHYSTHRNIIIEKEFLFEKMIDQRKGGYCMEHNTTFAAVLRTLGYNLYTLAARVYLPNDSRSTYPGGLMHMAIIVTINGIEYLVDVGFGGNGLTAPLPIFDGDSIETPIKGVLPEEHRVHRIELSGASKNGHKPWVLERRRNSQTEWEPVYVFEKDFEFFPDDYEVYVFLISTADFQDQHVCFPESSISFSQ
jgi:arylamine N-acetyltransferase